MPRSPAFVAAVSLFLVACAAADAAEPATSVPADQALTTMVPRPGFSVELAIAEPLVMDPVAFAWGADAKLWVVEMADYPLGMDGQGKPGGRVRWLEDTDRDGRYERSVVFLDNIPFPTGVLPWRKGVLVTAAPDIFYAEDTNGDGKADERRVLYTGFKEGNQQHRVNGLRWGLDNWIHGANGDSGGMVESKVTGKQVSISGRDFRIRPDEGFIEAQTGHTQFTRTCDDWGDWFGTSNSRPLMQYVLPDEYLRRNPHVPAVVPSVDVSTVPGAAPIYPRSRTVARFNDLNKSNRFTSACGETIYRDELFGPEFAGNSFVCEPVHNIVHREVLARHGPIFTSHRALDERRSEFLASTDNWCRPAMTRCGPDGALWVADMYRAVIEHPQWIPADWQKRLDLRAGHEQGRIWRVFPTGKRPRRIDRLDRLDAAGLAAALDHPSGTTRDLAQQLLVEGQHRAAIEPLKKLAVSAKRPQTRLQALATLDGLGGVDPALLEAALDDEHWAVRRWAVRLSEPWLNKSRELRDRVIKLAGDADGAIRMQVAFSLGYCTDSHAGSALGSLAEHDGRDPLMMAAVLSSVSRENLRPVLASVCSPRRNATPQVDAIRKLVGMAVAMKQLPDVSDAVRKFTGTSPSCRAAMVAIADGLEARGQSLARLPNVPKDFFEPYFAWARNASDNPKLPLAERETAVGLLARDQEHRSADLDRLAELLAPSQPRSLQSAALAALAARGGSQAPKVLLAAWKGLGPELRNQVLDAMLARPAWTAALLDAIEHGQVAAGELDATRSQRLLQQKDPALRTRTQKLLAGATSSDRQKVIESYQEATTLTGDPARGREVFAKRCASCHKLAGVGHSVGPDLTALTDKSPKSLLVAVLDPNKAVEAKYISYTAITTSGLTHTGMLIAETDSSVTLLAAEGKEIPLLRSDLEALASTSKSLMPEGLEKDVKPQDLADVFALIADQKPPRKAFAGNEPRVVEPEALRGEFYLNPEQAEIYGDTLVLEDRYDNLGFWQSENDHAAWTVDVRQAGAYDVSLEYACPDAAAGDTYVVDLGGAKLTGQVQSTGSWDTYRPVPLGRVQLAAGRLRVIVRSVGKPHASLFDLKTVRIKPVN